MWGNLIRGVHLLCRWRPQKVRWEWDGSPFLFQGERRVSLSRPYRYFNGFRYASFECQIPGNRVSGWTLRFAALLLFVICFMNVELSLFLKGFLHMSSVRWWAFWDRIIEMFHVWMPNRPKTPQGRTAVLLRFLHFRSRPDPGWFAGSWTWCIDFFHLSPDWSVTSAPLTDDSLHSRLREVKSRPPVSPFYVQWVTSCNQPHQQICINRTSDRKRCFQSPPHAECNTVIKHCKSCPWQHSFQDPRGPLVFTTPEQPSAMVMTCVQH